MYPTRYMSNGGEFVRKTDSTKEYHITDNLGSTRTVVGYNMKNGVASFKGYDYRPFGDSLKANGQFPRLSFNHEEKDFENGYFQMGARQYDPTIGRFLSCDPLLEMFPCHTPYQYAYNSPMIWKDPTGLEPKKIHLESCKG